MSRKKIIAGNWKMNKTPSEAVELVKTLAPLVQNPEVDVVYCVPAIDIIPVRDAIAGSNVHLGAENVYFEESGAFTGEISPAMLKDAGVEYVIIGHSERRGYFGETDQDINKKLLKLLEHGFNPIVCCGESLEQRESGITMDWINMQIKIAFQGVTADQAKGVVIAYEPIWAIGTGKTATTAQAEEVCKGIRETICGLYDEATAAAIRIQYGGSMNAKNCAELLAEPDIDGGLIGGAALKPDFGTIVNYNK
ncbi:MAG: triose-phosphate isomerase [Stomatobaculum sp.]|jgi:triosephosphate isomerase|nr:triose-phosphate isomerase [Stomatobaculum sp.]MBR7057243.1 triose-phosphate isomerase [Stomatobaculum sp.]